MTPRIVHVNKAYPPDIGGVEVVCQQYAEMSVAVFEQVEVLTISSDFGWKCKIETIARVKIWRCDFQFKIAGHKFSIPLIILLWKFIVSGAVIHLHDPFPLANIPLLFAKKLRLIVTYHSDIVKQTVLKKVIDWMRYRVLRNACLVTITSKNLQTHSDLLRRVNPSRQIVVPLFLDSTEKYKSPVELTKVSEVDRLIQDRKPFFLILERMCYYKGLDNILKATKRNQTQGFNNVFNVFLAGRVVDFEAKRIISQLSDHHDILIIDRILREEEKIYLLQSCSALLFPSNKNTEAFGIVQLEALATGKPVVNFNLPTGVPSVSLDGKTGLTLDLDDYEAIGDLLAGRGGYQERLDAIQDSLICDHLETFSKAKVTDTMLSRYQLFTEDNIS